jgi:hypothetical protein
MIKVKTFSTPIKIFATKRELDDLDVQVSAFLAEEQAKAVLALTDTTFTGDKGETIGLTRAVAYLTD